MGNEVYLPLADVVKRAAQSQVQGPAAKMKRRFADASLEVVVLCDLSSSMLDFIGNSGLRKYEHLAIALKDLMKSFPKVRLVVFNDLPRVLNVAADLPYPAGGTAMAKALHFIKKWKPRKTILISDGLPDDEQAALAAADQLTGAIDTIYCGPDEHPAVEFLRRLSRDTGGVQVTWDGYKGELASSVRALIAPPSDAIQL